MARISEIAPGVFQVSVMRVAVTVVMDGTRAVVLDAGFRITPPQVKAFLAVQGLHPQQVSHILVSHYHPDHIGGLRRLQAMTGALVGAHAVEAPMIRGDAPFPNPFVHRPLQAAFGGLARSVTPPPTPVDLPLADDDVIDVAGGIRVLHTPGHTPGSLSFYLPQRGVLFVGDALQRRFGRLGLPSALFTADMAAARASVQRLAQVDFGTLCFSHFASVGREAHVELDRLAAAVA